eukprot:scaffold150607_cov15-Prasinocladus_malaysianus.AAC.1
MKCCHNSPIIRPNLSYTALGSQASLNIHRVISDASQVGRQHAVPLRPGSQSVSHAQHASVMDDRPKLKCRISENIIIM